MSGSEKVKARMEQIAGRVVMKSAHALGKEGLAAKGGALETRGKARQAKEEAKDKLS